MEIVNRRLKDIRPYENNPRDNEAAVEYVKNSIEKFGFRVPVVVDKDGVIVCGHTRYKAAQLLGLLEVPCVVAEDLTEEQIRAFRLVDNKTQELAEWDWQKIGEELDAIDGIDMKLMGFAEFLDETDKGVKEKKIQPSAEIDPGSFEDESFSTVCPCCGFRFND